MNNILEDFIAKYFKKKLAPGIKNTYERLQKKYGVSTDENEHSGYQVGSFGFQTSFMMRYMATAFAFICLVLLVIALAVDPGAFQGLKIFITFFVLCLILWLISKLQSGFVIYTSQWICIDRRGKQVAFPLKSLKKISVLKTLTLFIDREADVADKVVLPLEGIPYLDFMTFLEKNCPEVIQEIPSNEYEKGKKKHGASWGNRL